jgi:hypothetical protein
MAPEPDPRASKRPGGAAPEILELPAPTFWPMVLAFGVTLVFSGLVTNMIVSVVGGVLTLAGAVGWWRQVLPVEQVEEVPLPPVAERLRPIAPSAAPVERFRLGEAGHRVRLPVEVQPLSAGVKGGIVGGFAMAVVALLYGAAFQRSIWYPINLLAAVAMPSMAQADLAELRAFSGTALLLGVIAHGVISVLAGLLYAVILPMLPRRHMLWGGLVAPLLWTGFLWALLGVINPTLNARVDWAWFIASQIAFGLATGFVVSRAHPIATMQTWPLAARAGVEAAGPGPKEERRR